MSLLVFTVIVKLPLNFKMQIKHLLTVLVVILLGLAYRVRQKQLSMRLSHLAGSKTISIGTTSFHDFNLTFVKRFNDTNGLEVATIYQSAANGICGSHIPPEKRPCTPAYHYHTKLTEHFTILQGVMVYKVDGKIGRAVKGDHIDIPPFTGHTFWMEGDQDLIFNQSVTSEEEMITDGHDTFFENMYGAYQDDINPIGFVYIVISHDGCIAYLPHFMNVAIRAVLDIIAPLLGFQQNYREYTTNCDMVPGCK
jgi:mannose-6-phosphate isomerase-like protein (cupin superfamily)